MYIDIGERIAGKQDGPSRIIEGPPRPPWIATNVTFGPIYEKLVVIFSPCYAYVCSMMRSYCREILITLNSVSKGPQNPPNMTQISYLFHILNLNLKSSYHIASLFYMYMYIDMGERIVGQQYRFSLIIAVLPRAPQITKNEHFLHFGPCMKSCLLIVFPCCTYISSVMRSAFADILPNMTPK